MQNSTDSPLLFSDTAIVLDGVRTALAKFPRIRNPVSRAKMFGRRLPAGPLIVKPRLYYSPTRPYETAKGKARRIKRELLDAGATVYGLMKSESRYLPKILHSDEHVEAVIYGQHESSSAMLVATDERIIYLDKKPMAELFDEVSYEVISGIQFDVHLFYATVVLHTPVKNYDFKMVNLHCAEKFARHIEKHRLEREPKQQHAYADLAPQLPLPQQLDGREETNYMAGYYWLPTDEEERRKVQQINV